ncbi:armadillo repeat-containing protein 3 isoform X1 [Simochromis diagramma]|uniref:armadillo repeat-containing protein 3 isoform X1 n=1 Tax=Simochromis diagramma TaxID=43689 RepID=UPI001A7EA143|nr:armadillo repeat-containing protein 3 isoform X1 [Simochromis diagramma]XP_039899692.1 armadillo repeat-containing protein 3 isoform X1 [Simochromis diagramma]
MGKKSRNERETPIKETFEPLPLESKAPATVVLLLNSPEEDILIKACEAIQTFAEKGDENKVSLLGLGALAPLCQLITHNNKLVRRNAFMALGIMATNGDVRTALKKLDAIPSIIEKLSLEDDTVVHEFATLCLASLSEDFLCKAQIFDNKGLPTLIQLLSSSDPDVKKNSLETISNLVQDYKSRLVVHELGGIPPLLQLLNSEFPVIQHLALKTLQHVTTDRDANKTFRDKQGFEKLMGILNNVNFSDLHAEALHVLANCLSDSESVQLIHKSGGLTKLMEFVLTPSVPEIRSGVIKCITRVAQSSESCKVLHEQDVETVLVELLSLENIGVMTSACQAVAALSFHLNSKERFRELGCISVLVQLLSRESLALREAATQALSNLTHNSESNAFEVYEEGGDKLLVQQLYQSCPKIVANSAATLCNIAEHEIIRCSILSHGAIQALLEPLKSTVTQVLVNTARCLAVLASDEEARTELVRVGGLQLLVNLLQSHSKEVLHIACLAVNVCASDVPTAVEMCKFGALEILQAINQSKTRRNSFSELAVNSLLNSNLSFKYSLTSSLASTDIITCGFYDAGKARPGQRMLTLEELSKQPVNQRQAIIFVNKATVLPDRETVDVPEETQNKPSESDGRVRGERKTPKVTVDVREETQSKPSESESRVKGDRKTPKKKKEEEQKDYGLMKKKEEKQKDYLQPESPVEKPRGMMEDVSLQILIKIAKEYIFPLNDEKEQCESLARLVSEAMGGAVEKEKMHEFSWILHLSELKIQLQSNVIPIGFIKKGIYYHRALLFKSLADCIGLSCTLVRGDYNRAWNEVLLFSRNSSNKLHSSQPCRYIVDLVHQPGNLFPVNSPAAVQYQTI